MSIEPTTARWVDPIETLLLLLMEEQDAYLVERGRTRVGRSKRVCDDLTKHLGFGDMMPAAPYTLDACDPRGRLLSASYADLLRHPKEIIGDSLETCLIFDGVAKWAGFRRLDRAPRGAACVGRAVAWYEAHYRSASAFSGWVEYNKSVVALGEKGQPLPVKMQGARMAGGGQESETLILACSMAEDAHRVGAVLAKATLDKSVIFPVSLEAYKEAFLIRDLPKRTPTGRKNPILHWCSGHIRRGAGPKPVWVKPHQKGADLIKFGDMELTLSINQQLRGFKRCQLN